MPVPAESVWIKRPWCLGLAGGILALGLISNLLFLYHHCPFDLSEDESFYWLWSRHLAWGYYTKGPGIAWIIHAAVTVGRWFGQAHATMPVIRTPAVIFAFISGLMSLLLARRIFRDDRSALMVMVLSAGMPVFAVGSLLITIDSPMYCAWAMATWCLWMAVEPRSTSALRPDRFSAALEHSGTPPKSAWGRSRLVAPATYGRPQQSPAALTAKNGPPSSPARPAWLYAAGVLIGLGMLVKPVLLFLPPSLAIAAWSNRYLRRQLATWHSAGALLLALVLQVPTLLWNAAHGWPMFRAIGAEGGIGPTAHILTHLREMPGHVLLYIGSQVGIAAGIMFVLLVLAAIDAILISRRHDDPQVTAPWCFLLSLALPIFGFYFVLSFWSKVQPNWPAAGYFTAMIILAGIATRRWNQPEKNRAYRRWLVAAVAVGFALFVFGENTQRLYPLAAKWDSNGRWPPQKWDPAARLHGLKARGAAIQRVRRSMGRQDGHWPLVISNRWDTASSLSFYLPGHPFVFCIESLGGGPKTQFNLWPGLDQINPRTGKLRYQGRNAVLTGAFSSGVLKHWIQPAFRRMGHARLIPVYYRGVRMKTLVVWRCYGFKGFP